MFRDGGGGAGKDRADQPPRRFQARDARTGPPSAYATGTAAAEADIGHTRSQE